MTEEFQNPDSFIAGIARHIDAHRLIENSAGIILAVSGGADSVAMLSAMRDLAGSGRGYRIVVAHLNHKLREDAQADADFVAGLAASWHLPCVVESADVAAHARSMGQSVEQAGRSARYEFLLEQAAKHNCGYVATGHHADDNVETILYRIIRGTALSGLCGIPVSRSLLGRTVKLVRPMLFAHRNEIEEYCRRCGLEWKTDLTNADQNYRRNFIRHNLLELISEKLNPRADEALLRLARVAGEADDLLEQLALELFKKSLVTTNVQLALDVEKIRKSHLALQAYVLRIALERSGVPLRMIGMEELSQLRDLIALDRTGCINLPGNFAARFDGGTLTLQKNAVAKSKNAELSYIAPGGMAIVDDLQIKSEVCDFDPALWQRHVDSQKTLDLSGRFDSYCELIDADEIRGRVFVRPRLDGDSFMPLGSSGHKSVSDFLTDLKLPQELRGQVKCICDDLGIICLWPLRIDNRLRITPQTTRLFRLTAEKIS